MLVNREGQTFPPRTFRTRHNRQWVDVTTDQIFKGKTIRHKLGDWRSCQGVE